MLHWRKWTRTERHHVFKALHIAGSTSTTGTRPAVQTSVASYRVALIFLKLSCSITVQKPCSLLVISHRQRGLSVSVHTQQYHHMTPWQSQEATQQGPQLRTCTCPGFNHFFLALLLLVAPTMVALKSSSAFCIRFSRCSSSLQRKHYAHSGRAA
jgi:hypothetical protein